MQVDCLELHPTLLDHAHMTGESERIEWALGAQLRAAMTDLGWSERRTAKESGVSAQTVSNLLRGHLHGQPAKPWRPTVANLRGVVRALRAAGYDVSEAEWLGLAGFQPGEYLAIEGDPVGANSEYLVSRIKQLLPTERAAVETLVEAILRSRAT